MRFLRVLILGLCLGIPWRYALAHHVVGHSASTGFYNPFAAASRPPRTFFSLNFSVDWLDHGLGELYRYQLSGEYAVHPRFSLGAQVSFLSVREKFLAPTDSIGDISLTAKGLLWHSVSKKQSLHAGLGISLPTGQEDLGLGSGDVMFSPYFTYVLNQGRADFYLTLGTSLAAASQLNPSWDYSLGSNIALLKKGPLPMDFFVALQGSTIFSSDTFTAGSTKIYATPGLILHLKPDFFMTLGGKISVIDTLNLKPGIALAKSSIAPLSDVETGLVVDFDWFF